MDLPQAANGSRRGLTPVVRSFSKRFYVEWLAYAPYSCDFLAHVRQVAADVKGLYQFIFRLCTAAGAEVERVRPEYGFRRRNPPKCNALAEGGSSGAAEYRR